jgi:hypothetical protein
MSSFDVRRVAMGHITNGDLAPACSFSSTVASRIRAQTLLGRLVWLALFASLAASGCTFGARMIESSVGPYNQAVTRVGEEQLLLNVVRLRYNDNPTRLDVSSIAAQYELDATAEARPFFEAPNPAGSVFQTFTRILPDVMGTAANRPTISLIPLDDPETMRGLFTPATLDGIVFIAETSYPLSTVFQLFVEYMNHVPNAPTASGPPRAIVPQFRDFKRAAGILQELKDAGDLQFIREEKLTTLGSRLSEQSVNASALVEAAKNGFEYQRQADNTWALVKRDRKLVLHIRREAASRPDVVELANLLHLRPDRSRYDVTVGSKESLAGLEAATNLDAVNIYPRSVIQACYYASHGIEIPPEHYACGLVRPSVLPDGQGFDWQEVFQGLFTVHTVMQFRRPDCAFVAVKYRDYWYYIDDRDADTKTTFSLLLTMTRINLLGTRKGGPMLTLPVGSR